MLKLLMNGSFCRAAGGGNVKGAFYSSVGRKTPDELLRQLRRAVRLLNGSSILTLWQRGSSVGARRATTAQSSPPPAAANRIYPYPLGAEYYQAGDADNEQNQ